MNDEPIVVHPECPGHDAHEGHEGQTVQEQGRR